MKIIEKISEQIEEELEDAEKYAMCALSYKDSDPALADTYYRLSNEEMEHMDMLHAQVTNQISEFKKTRGDPPEAMMMLYEILHKKHIAKAVAVRQMQAMYKE